MVAMKTSECLAALNFASKRLSDNCEQAGRSPPQRLIDKCKQFGRNPQAAFVNKTGYRYGGGMSSQDRDCGQSFAGRGAGGGGSGGGFTGGGDAGKSCLLSLSKCIVCDASILSYNASKSA